MHNHNSWVQKYAFRWRMFACYKGMFYPILYTICFKRGHSPLRYVGFLLFGCVLSPASVGHLLRVTHNSFIHKGQHTKLSHTPPTTRSDVTLSHPTLHTHTRTQHDTILSPATFIFHVFNLFHAKLISTSPSTRTCSHTQFVHILSHTPTIAIFSHHLYLFLPFPPNDHVKFALIGRNWHVGLSSPLMHDTILLMRMWGIQFREAQ